MMYGSQIIMLYTLKLYSAVCQLYLNKTGRKKFNVRLMAQDRASTAYHMGFLISLHPRLAPARNFSSISSFFFLNVSVAILFLFIYLFIYYFFWLRWVFVATRGLSLVVVSGGYSSLPCAGSSLPWLLLLQSTGSRHAGFSSCGTRAQ